MTYYAQSLSEILESWPEPPERSEPKRRIGLSKTRPKNEARPLGITQKQFEAKQRVDSTTHLDVRSVQLLAPTPIPTSDIRSAIMTLTYKGLSKNSRNAFYTGARVALRLPLSAFPNKTAPPSIGVDDGVFEPAKTPKVKLSKEERKALPKPTLAERAQRARERADKLAARVVKESADATM